MGWVLNVRKDDLWPPDFFNLVNVFFFQHTLASCTLDEILLAELIEYVFSVSDYP
eukprot:m.152320 g.152320  ORF g.152320 m.152320 type:complete len:55 (-) comp14317_c0_seq5:502-666(-)